MRKYLAIFIVLVCLAGLVGCNQSAPSKTSEPNGENVSVAEISNEITVENAIGETAALSLEDAETLLAILENGGWYDEPTECASDCRLVIGENYLSYHSDCGTFNGSFKGEDFYYRGSLMTDDETQQLINGILEQYVALGQY